MAKLLCLLLMLGIALGLDTTNDKNDDRQLLERIEKLERGQLDLMRTIGKLEETVLSQRETMQYQEKELTRVFQGCQCMSTSPNKRLDVSAVTLSPVAFSAYIGHTLANLVPGTVIPFETVTTNEGKAFDGQKGIFTCPTSGLYLFVWNVMVDAGHSTQVYLAVNGAIRRWSYAFSTGSYANAANHDIVRLQEGDKVWIANHYNDGEIHPHHTTFAGVLLFE